MLLANDKNFQADISSTTYLSLHDKYQVGLIKTPNCIIATIFQPVETMPPYCGKSKKNKLTVHYIASQFCRAVDHYSNLNTDCHWKLLNLYS